MKNKKNKRKKVAIATKTVKPFFEGVEGEALMGIGVKPQGFWVPKVFS